MSDRMDEILKGLAVGDWPIELRMQSDNSAHDRMLQTIRAAALTRLRGAELEAVLAQTDQSLG